MATRAAERNGNQGEGVSCSWQKREPSLFLIVAFYPNLPFKEIKPMHMVSLSSISASQQPCELG